MSSAIPRLVVVHRRADPTAETVALVELVRALAATGEVRVEVLLLAGGALLDEFEQVAPTTVVAALESRSRAAIVERVCFALRLRGAGYRRRAARLHLDHWGPGDAVYLHTVLGVQVLRYLPSDRPVVLCRLAEDVHPLRHPLVADDLRVLLRRVDRFLAVTTAGLTEMVEVHGLDPDRVRRMPELFVPPDDRLPDRSGEREQLRRRLDIRPGAVVVGSFGASDADSPDLGVLLWSMVSRRSGDRAVELIWGYAESEAGFWMEHDLQQTGLVSGVHAVEAGSELLAYLELCDVLILLTRIDDYPFAYLQRAASGVPVLCFEGNRLADLVYLGDPQHVAPYLDVVALADQVSRLLESSDALARNRVAMLEAVARVHGPEVVGRRLLDEVAALTEAAQARTP